MDDQCNDDVVSITSHGASVLAVQVQIGNAGHLPHLLTLPDFQLLKLLDHVGLELRSVQMHGTHWQIE